MGVVAAKHGVLLEEVRVGLQVVEVFFRPAVVEEVEVGL